jgi:formylglycine-generating enzyme required for sulfatase activity
VGLVLLAFGMLGIAARAMDIRERPPVGTPTMSGGDRADATKGTPEQHVDRPPPGMVRLDGAAVRLGHFDHAGRPPECFQLTAAEDCDAALHPERVRTVNVAAFDLEIEEVTNSNFARWLRDNPTMWDRSRKEDAVIVFRDDGGTALAWGGPACSGLRIDAAGNVGVTAGDERRPVTCVSWYAATRYCAARSKRLPT